MSRSKKDILETEAMLTRLTNLLLANRHPDAASTWLGYRADAESLRRISMTLRRWFELECGDSDDYGSWAIERGKEAPRPRWQNPWQGQAITVPARLLLQHSTLTPANIFDGGYKLDEMDAYVLRGPAGLSIGFRYGNANHEYLSPSCTNEKAADALAAEYSDDGRPYMVRHSHRGDGRTTRTPIADREAGARKRLAAILKRYPSLSAYVQTDPRGCALYILKPGDVPAGEDVSAYYSRGLAVHQ